MCSAFRRWAFTRSAHCSADPPHSVDWMLWFSILFGPLSVVVLVVTVHRQRLLRGRQGLDEEHLVMVPPFLFSVVMIL